LVHVHDGRDRSELLEQNRQYKTYLDGLIERIVSRDDLLWLLARQ